ncbi:hypothetical protein O0Z71_00735 [Ligilactobacillus saerimneri]|uniref:hypothetical protein n=1 Tax=Ligilactobacillus saerimneri TaxID=228229 RepID=UPI0022A7D0FE|nr:hypothetical protein [Ligilactobacillus saerimneri]MCZ0890983.1 hypothetical protein [Ligilactobacillus saerimneri]
MNLRRKRNTFGTFYTPLLFETGATSKEIQTRLEHASADLTVNTYTHVMDDRKKHTGARFANYLNEQSNQDNQQEEYTLFSK